MIHYQVDMQDLTQLESALGMLKDKTKYVLRGAINETAKQTRVLLADEAAKEYVMKRATFLKQIEIDKATVTNLTAYVKSEGGVNELYDFKVSPHTLPRSVDSKPRYYKGKTKVQNPLAKLILRPGRGRDQYKAFVVRYQSGHITIGQRVPGKRMISKPHKEFVKTLLSPSVPKMLGNENGVYGVVEPKMNDLLMKSIQEQIIRFMK